MAKKVATKKQPGLRGKTTKKPNELEKKLRKRLRAQLEKETPARVVSGRAYGEPSVEFD